MWLALGDEIFKRTFGYIVFYPFIIVGWKVPRLLIKNWAMAIAFSPAIHQFAAKAKVNFIISVSIIVFGFLICNAPINIYLIEVGIFVLTINLITHFIKKFKSSYSSETVFTIVRSNIIKIITFADNEVINKKLEENPDTEQYQKNLDSLTLVSYLIVTSLHLSVIKTKEIINSKKMDLYFITSLLWTFVFSGISFGIIYFGLYRIDNSNFNVPDNVNVIDFIGFSFSTLMTSSISTITVASGVSQLFSYAQLFTSLLLLVLLVFSILTSIRERYKKDLDDLLIELESSQEKMRLCIESKYEISIDEMENKLIKDHTEVMKLIIGIKYGNEKKNIIFKKHDEENNKCLLP
ncbi:hypothetical protein [Photobacterium leiognathi]|uniref:hypothetical protein n=1 Tax=Photobacterium leiognathi TaxID=553611 RepID=UPI002738BD71|nr:hypothetical protein [Photobacterium leiognathi]